MPFVEDTQLKQHQEEVHKTSPMGKAFCHGEAHMQMRVAEDVYENARLANLDECGGGNIWDDPEYCRDMMTRHPELCAPLERKSFNMNPHSYGGLLKAKNKFGKVKTRVRFRNGMRIEDRFDDGVREVRDPKTGQTRMYDLESGVEL